MAGARLPTICWLALHSSIAGSTNWTQWVILKRWYKVKKQYWGEGIWLDAMKQMYENAKNTKYSERECERDLASSLQLLSPIRSTSTFLGGEIGPHLSPSRSGTCYVNQTDLKLLILLALPPS